MEKILFPLLILLLGMGGTAAASSSSSSSWYLRGAAGDTDDWRVMGAEAEAGVWAGMPGVRRSDVWVMGQHPTVIAIAPVPLTALDGTAPCTEVAIDVPFWRHWNSGSTPAPPPGPVHFFIWTGPTPPSGSGFSLVNSAREVWIDSGTAVWQATGVPLAPDITAYRFVHNLTNLPSLDASVGNTLYVGLFVEQALYAPGLMDWLAQPAALAGGGGSNATGNTTTLAPFLYIDYYGTFILGNTTLAQPQMLVTTAPKATSYYSSMPTATPVAGLPLRVWTRCADGAGLVGPGPLLGRAAATPTPAPAPPPSLASASPVGSPTSATPTPTLMPVPLPPATPAPAPLPAPPSMLSVTLVSGVVTSVTATPPPWVWLSPVPPTSFGDMATPSVAAAAANASSSPPSTEELGKLEFNTVVFLVAVGTALLIVVGIAIAGLCVFVARRQRVRDTRRSLATAYMKGAQSPDDEADDAAAISLEEVETDADDDEDEDEPSALYRDDEAIALAPVPVGVDELARAMSDSRPKAPPPKPSLPMALVGVGATPRDSTVIVPLESPASSPTLPRTTAGNA